MKKFLNKWGDFLGILFGPGATIFIAITVLGLIFAYNFKNDTLFSTLLSILSSISAGVAGNFVKDDYDKLIGKNILEKKGRSAWRNLQSISTQLCNIKEWLSVFAKENKKNDNRSLDEIHRHISTIQLNINSGLEDWVDIVPELKAGKEKNIEIEKQYRDYLQTLFSELIENRKELSKSKDEKRTDELKKKILDLEKEMKDIKKSNSHFIQPLETINLSQSSGLFMMNNRCSKCGRIYLKDSNDDSSVCSNCNNGVLSSVFKSLLP
ncbi:MAG: hypothetical protein WC055_15190 [Melioribacteraceae bacterium]